MAAIFGSPLIKDQYQVEGIVTYKYDKKELKFDSEEVIYFDHFLDSTCINFVFDVNDHDCFIFFSQTEIFKFYYMRKGGIKKEVIYKIKNSL